MANTIPPPTAPIAGNLPINEYWWRFFLNLFQDTGSGNIDLDIVRKNIADLQTGAEEADNSQSIAALQFSDQDLSSLIDAVPYYPVDTSCEGMSQTHGLQTDPLLHDVATTTANGFMSASDKSKLNLIPNIISPIALTADVTATNSAADIPILSVTIPAGGSYAGNSYYSRTFGHFTLGAGTIGSAFNFWIKVNGTKVVTLSLTTPSVLSSATGLFSSSSLTVRTVGSTGTLEASIGITGPTGILSSGPTYTSSGASIDTTISNTITIGFNWGVANAGLTAVFHNSVLGQEA